MPPRNMMFCAAQGHEYDQLAGPCPFCVEEAREAAERPTRQAGLRVRNLAAPGLLRTWRTSHELTLAQAARLLGYSSAQNYARAEASETLPGSVLRLVTLLHEPLIYQEAVRRWGDAADKERANP